MENTNTFYDNLDAIPSTVERPLTDTERAFYHELRRALIMAVRAIEKFAEIEPAKHRCEKCRGEHDD